ncbi:uncharacterized protein [Dermacentor andersoni]|uniref:uncharacterized protein n=1 Tax=Dermacentor andersoni TaxID=34620 RepID=UPI003B3AA570
MQDATDLGLNLMTDPAYPTRIGNSMTRDTTPDLTFVRSNGGGMADFEWRNTGHELGSDHYIVEVVVPLGGNDGVGRSLRKHRFTDWDAFRGLLPEEQTEITDIEEWSTEIVNKVEKATKEVETDERVHRVDSRLAHLIAAKQSILSRWKTQRTNRKLRKKVAELNREIESHSRVLCTQQWNEVCNAADGQMHCGKTWSMLRHLLDATTTKSHQHHNLAKIIHRALTEHGEDEVKKRLDDKYLPVTPTETHPDYLGEANEWLDRDIEVWEVRVALHDLNSNSAAGPDRVTNRALKNLNEAAIEYLTAYFNTCWRAGSLPRQWKAAKTILIPKPGKPPNIENLRPISLTSCVGKALEHVLMNRWQRYLEDSGLYPNTVIGFRNKLGTQDAMIQLKNEILDDTTNTKDKRAILGLDLLSAFDKVRHSAILAQVSRLNMGKRTYAYIKDFLTERTTEIIAGDLRLQKKKLGSVGTPQGSVISPLLFNLVMIGVAERLSRVARVRHTIYADDITLWVPGGSDGHIEDTLQEAVDAIEEQLDGSGLVCSPSKSELLVIPPKRTARKTKGNEPAREQDTIKIRTSGGHMIPVVEKIRVLGMLIERKRVNGETVNRLAAKVTTAIRLIKRVSHRTAGMKEESLTRLLESFAISHITYVAAFHNWRQCERNKINALIRKAYKAALGLVDCTSTDKFLALGVHNTLEEIAEAQRTAQLARLSETRTGRQVLRDLGLGPKEMGPENTEVPVPDAISRRLPVCPVPRNMNPEFHKERRAARAKALIDLHAKDRGAVFVDAAEYPHDRKAFAAAVVGASTGATRTAASVRTRGAHQAEEVAIALAIADPECTTVLCDSRTAVKNYARARVCGEAASVLRVVDLASESRCVMIKWFPAHMGSDVSDRGNANHNETVNAAARGLTNRAAATTADPSWWWETKDKMTSYNEIVKWYRLERRTMPPPHPGLTRKEAVLYRQLQTGSLFTPVLMRHVCRSVYESDLCCVCRKERATAAHILWDCAKNPHEAATITTIPPRLEAATRCYDQDVQTQAVQQISTALERQRPSETGGRLPPQKRGSYYIG